MNVSIALPIAVCLIGLALYLIAANPKVQESGRLMFAMGILATMLKFAGTAALSVGH